MKAFTMTAHEQDFILGILIVIPIQSIDIVDETFPLRLLSLRIKLVIGRIQPV